MGAFGGRLELFGGHLTAFNGTESDDEDNGEDLGAIWEYLGQSRAFGDTVRDHECFKGRFRAILRCFESISGHYVR